MNFLFAYLIRHIRADKMEIADNLLVYMTIPPKIQVSKSIKFKRFKYLNRLMF